MDTGQRAGSILGVTERGGAVSIYELVISGNFYLMFLILCGELRVTEPADGEDRCFIYEAAHTALGD